MTGMADQTLLLIVGALGFVVNITVLAVGGVWKLSRVEQAIRETVTDHREEIDREFVTLRSELQQNLLAIRQKVTDVEIWGRDNFVKKDTFTQVVTGIRDDLKGVGDRIEARLLRMESKMDHATSQRAD